MTLSRIPESLATAVLGLLVAGVLVLSISYDVTNQSVQTSAVRRQTAQCLNDTRACAGAFAVWTDAGRILRLGNCSGNACGVGEIPIEWLRFAQKSEEERELFPYEEIVFQGDGLRWYQTALKFHWQFISRR